MRRKGSGVRRALPRIEIPESGAPITELLRRASPRRPKRRLRSLKRQTGGT